MDGAFAPHSKTVHFPQVHPILHIQKENTVGFTWRENLIKDYFFSILQKQAFVTVEHLIQTEVRNMREDNMFQAQEMFGSALYCPSYNSPCTHTWSKISTKAKQFYPRLSEY
ncbi:hypothetical protein AB205_0064630 [Aquarana catesbeiana]|uniref:Uncharacterized protein n=1 Tax=Aquarana catesbeiana TaxID=8400 RepID=A0A2G9SFM5_AQUCT|nr:hypothetical protein AB205_0064630 [Aquarana catesbeiana]